MSGRGSTQSSSGPSNRPPEPEAAATIAATALLDTAERDPKRAERESMNLLSAATGPALPIVWRARGIALRLLGQVNDSLAAFDAAVSTALDHGDPRLVGMARVSRSGSRFMAGDMAGGVADLDAALATLTGADRGIALFQRAQYLDVIGDPAADVTFGDALRALAEGDERYAKYRGHALANRGLHRATTGRLVEAERDLLAAQTILDALGLEALVAAVVHNLGLIAHYRGNFARALERFERAHARSTNVGHESSDAGRDYCEALLTVGLAREASERASELAAHAAAAGDQLASAELWLTAAWADVQVGGLDAARRAAEAARDGFRGAQRVGWEAQAALAVAHIDVLLGQGDEAALDALSRHLDRHGFHDAALSARLLAADSACARGFYDDAERRLAALAGRLASARFDRRLHAITIAALIAERRDDRALVARHVRRAVRTIDTVQRLVGAADARAHVAVHAARVLAVGRRHAASQRRAPDAWRSFERLSGLSTRHPAARLDDDGELGGLMAHLRQISTELGELEPDGDRWAALAVEQRRLQRRVGDLVRSTAGRSDASAAGLSIEAVRTRLGERAMVAIFPADDTLHVFTLTDRLRRRALVLSEATARAEAAHLATRRLARRTTPVLSQQLAAGQLAQLAAWFDLELLDDAIDSRPVVIVVPEQLVGVPWGLLPRLRTRRWTLVPSVASWLAAEQRQREPRRADRRPLLIAGSGLNHAAAEVTRVSTAHQRPTILSDRRATAEQALPAIAASSLVHLAAHYAVRPGNALFSSFELERGPLFLHELAQLARVPATWVIPSCESALGDAPVIGEQLGLPSVLLGLGARSIVTASGLVPDDEVTVELMVALHDELSRGYEPATALATARTACDHDDAPQALAVRAVMACYGAG